MSGTNDALGRQLRTVFVLVRHGSRTPCHPDLCLGVEFKDDLVKHPAHTFTPIEVIFQKEEAGSSKQITESVYEETYLKGGKCKPGQLVAQGAHDQYEVGQKLREQYIEDNAFLNKSYVTDDVEVMSSYFQRATESSRSILAGMYPDRPVAANPIPIYVSNSSENIILPIHPCLKSISNLIRKNPSVVPGLEDAVNQVKEILSFEGVFDLSYLWDNLKTLKELNLLPELPDKLWDLSSTWGAEWFAMRSVGTEKHRLLALQLFSGMLIDFILNKVEELSNGKRTPKLHLLCGHDGTLWSLMHIMQFGSSRLPPPTNSTLILETYEETDGNSFSINVVYNGKQQLIFDSKETFCDVGKFRTMVEKYCLTKEKHKRICKNFEEITSLI